MANGTLNVLVVGTGKRVLSTALPAFASQGSAYAIRRLFARRPKTVEAAGREHSVEAFEGITAADLDGIDLVYLAVTKDAVPSVLQRFSELPVSGIDVLIDTPVVRFKHFGHGAKLSAFRNAWVAEDVAFLPWIDAVRAAVAGGSIGSLRTLLLLQSAYAYHGVALAKAVAGSNVVRKGTRQANTGRAGLRHMRMGNGVEVHVVEPRNYESGRMAFVGTKGSIADFPYHEESLLLEPQVKDGLIVGYTCGDHQAELTPSESELTAGDPEGATVTARMNAAKRVGFARLLGAIRSGSGGYPIGDAMDDMVVDYHLEKFRRYRANPLTSYRSPLARSVLGAVTKRG